MYSTFSRQLVGIASTNYQRVAWTSSQTDPPRRPCRSTAHERGEPWRKAADDGGGRARGLATRGDRALESCAGCDTRPITGLTWLVNPTMQTPTCRPINARSSQHPTFKTRAARVNCITWRTAAEYTSSPHVAVQPNRLHTHMACCLLERNPKLESIIEISSHVFLTKF